MFSVCVVKKICMRSEYAFALMLNFSCEYNCDCLPDKKAPNTVGTSMRVLRAVVLADANDVTYIYKLALAHGPLPV